MWAVPPYYARAKGGNMKQTKAEKWQETIALILKYGTSPCSYSAKVAEREVLSAVQAENDSLRAERNAALDALAGMVRTFYPVQTGVVTAFCEPGLSALNTLVVAGRMSVIRETSVFLETEWVTPRRRRGWCAVGRVVYVKAKHASSTGSEALDLRAGQPLWVQSAEGTFVHIVTATGHRWCMTVDEVAPTPPGD
jgi:hypothetical protein